MNAAPSFRVLIVEDEPMIKIHLEQTLETIGAEVVGTANSTERGLELARTAEVDIALLDVMLNGDLSFPIAEELERRGIPFVYVTGHPQRVHLDGQFNATSVEKPFSDEEVANAIEESFERQKEREAGRPGMMSRLAGWMRARRS